MSSPASFQRCSKRVRDWISRAPRCMNHVACWNELGANVSLSISKGDPVIVKGQLSTDEWECENGKRSKTVCTALSVGHDLSRGTTVFKRAARSAPAFAPSAEQVVEEVGPDVPTDEEYALVDLETGELVGAS